MIGDRTRVLRLTAVAVILAGATGLRLTGLTQTPPGLHQDEASEAWNAYCLLKTGRDQVGESWPVFYKRSLGDNSTTLHMYWLIPFQLFGGLGVYTTRLPAAAAGVLTVLLTYFVGRRLFGSAVGLIAALLLSLNPWHLHLSRIGHDASICPLLVMLPLAALLWAGLPFDGDEHCRPRPWRALVAGLLAGVCCYGYWAVRLFMPVFLVGMLAATWSAWWSILKTRRGRLASFAMLVGVAATFGPLAFMHIAFPEEIARHGGSTLLWNGSDPAEEVAYGILVRYVRHFSPEFLFIGYDHYQSISIPGWGHFHWYMLPLMVAGLDAVRARFRTSAAARALAVWTVLYPCGDLLAGGPGCHPLRSSPGMCGLILLGALGTVHITTSVWNHRRWLAGGVLACLVGLALFVNFRLIDSYFTRYSQRPDVYHLFHVDLVHACQWVKPRLGDVDAVFWTNRHMKAPYIVTLVALGYPPHQWHNDAREIHTPGEFDIYARYGKMYFMEGDWYREALKKLQTNDRRDRVLFVVRPHELGLKDPVHVIKGPQGTEELWICEQIM